MRTAVVVRRVLGCRVNMIKRRYRILSLVFIFFWVVPCAFGEPTEIRILHLNDFHGFAGSSQYQHATHFRAKWQWYISLPILL